MSPSCDFSVCTIHLKRIDERRISDRYQRARSGDKGETGVEIPAGAELLNSGATLACSAVTVGETFAGMRSHESARTEELFNQLTIFDVTAEIARYAGLLKNEWASKDRTLSLADAMIAATAIAHKLTLITDNRKDFPMAELQLHPGL